MKNLVITLGVAALFLIKVLIPFAKGFAFAGIKGGAQGVMALLAIVAVFVLAGVAWRILKARIALRGIRTVR